MTAGHSQCLSRSIIGLFPFMVCAYHMDSYIYMTVCLCSAVLIVIPLLVCIVRFSVHFPTVFRSFVFYIQISPIATEYLTRFRLRTDVVSTIIINCA